MAGLMKRESRPADLFDRFDRMFDEWMKSSPFRRPMMPTTGREWDAPEMIRVDELRENGDLVIRAELPGVDPDKDVDVTIVDGMLHIEGRRHEEERSEEQGYLRREIRTGSFARTLPLPAGVSETDVTATYTDGMLEIRVPTPAPEPDAAPTKVPVTKT